MAKEFESNGVKVEIPDELESVVALEYSCLLYTSPSPRD